MKKIAKKSLFYLIRKSGYFNLKVVGKPKIFCIGRNKTGTTSFAKAMKDLGFVVGYQHDAERFVKEYKNRDFRKIIKYCKTAQVFQDFPFSCSETYKYLDKAFPNSKFILTIRDSAKQWYNSVVSFATKLNGKGGRIPTKSNLQNSNYIYKGRAWDVLQINYNTPEEDLWNKEIFTNHYNYHNRDVLNYFKDRPKDLLVINLSDKNSYKKMINFLNIESPYKEFPWENRTSDIGQ